MRVWFALLILNAGVATAALPDAAKFADDVDTGRVNPESFDFAATGWWDVSLSDRMIWYGQIMTRLEFQNPTAFQGCAPQSQRRMKAMLWTIPVIQAADASAWSEAVLPMRARLATFDAQVEAAATAVKRGRMSARLFDLTRRFARDQEVRERFFHASPGEGLPPLATAAWGGVLATRMDAIDCDNTQWLRAQLKKIGWFDIPTYGVDADNAAWHLVQHADRTPEFQRSTLAYLAALPDGKTSKKNLAYLWDRVESGQGRLQRYGTQGTCMPDGSWKPHPVEDPEHLDERRVAAGMKPIAEHAAALALESCLQPKS